MIKLKRIINSLAVFFTGMLIASLWIYHNEAWEIYLPIIFLLIFLKNSLDD